MYADMLDVYANIHEAKHTGLYLNTEAFVDWPPAGLSMRYQRHLT